MWLLVGYAVLDLSGWRVSWDPPPRISNISNEAVHFDAFDEQVVEVWDALDQIQAEKDAHWDDTLVYGKSLLISFYTVLVLTLIDRKTRKWQRRELETQGNSPKGKKNSSDGKLNLLH
jgi:hypothetical protein